MNDLFGAAIPNDPFELPSGRGYDVRRNGDLGGYEVALPNGELFYAERFFDQKVSDRTVEYFQENDTADWRQMKWQDLGHEELERVRFTNINWKQDFITLYGKRSPLPRLTSWYGDSGRTYTYSGITSRPNQWNKGLLYIRQRVEDCAGATFNSVLLNWYRDGGDHLSWHSDDEKELGVNPIIASANIGETRDFVIRRKDDHSQRIVLPLKHGTLLIMKGEMQHFWEHSVPKRKNVRGSRFNLTFRRINPDAERA